MMIWWSGSFFEANPLQPLSILRLTIGVLPKSLGLWRMEGPLERWQWGVDNASCCGGGVAGFGETGWTVLDGFLEWFILIFDFPHWSTRKWRIVLAYVFSFIFFWPAEANPRIGRPLARFSGRYVQLCQWCGENRTGLGSLSNLCLVGHVYPDTLFGRILGSRMDVANSVRCLSQIDAKQASRLWCQPFRWGGLNAVA